VSEEAPSADAKKEDGARWTTPLISTATERVACLQAASLSSKWMLST
jgi:hypothetical protein